MSTSTRRSGAIEPPGRRRGEGGEEAADGCSRPHGVTRLLVLQPGGEWNQVTARSDRPALELDPAS